MPLTMSSILRSMAADSTAVLMVCTFTSYGSQIPSSCMSVISPVLPSIPYVLLFGSECFARSFVSTRITFVPQFCASVRGITSTASPTARYGHCSMPSTEAACSDSAREMAISTAPPPGSSRGSLTTLRATPIASCRLRSTSLSTSREAPRKMMVQALGSSQSTKKVKYSSPSFLTSKRPAFVPTSLSLISSQRCTMVAPVARAIRLLSVLRRRRMALMPALPRKWLAKSLRPFSVMTTSGFTAAM
mmetsp:Transcript_12217/g.44573  ORF Transcript_12217/g.44573 Transcript_12217/m.44573 type:complete len:246 (+) Transcript_12217:1563-2300(+)